MALGCDSSNLLRMSAPGEDVPQQGTLSSHAAGVSLPGLAHTVAERNPQRLSLLLRTSCVGIFRGIGVFLELFACGLVARSCLTDCSIWFY